MANLKKRKLRGFGMSLLEILISIFLLGAALLPIFSLIGKGQQMARTNEDEILAFNLGAELVDQIACFPYNTIPVLGDRSLSNSDNGAYLIEVKGSKKAFNPTLLILSELPKGFERFLTIEEFNNRPNCCLKKVTARISYGTTPRRNFTITSLVAWRP